MTPDEIARAEVQWVWPDGRTVPGVIVIARPSHGDDGWSCLATLEGLPTPGLGPIAGEDALQALTLALTMVRRELDQFVAQGGRVRDTEGSAFPVAAYFPSW